MGRNWTEADLAEIIKRSKPRRVRVASAVGAKSPPKKYNNEAKLQKIVEFAGLPVPVLEYKFLSSRRFKFDLAWPDRMLACEVDGMVHRIKSRFLADMEKMNLAREAGWSVVHVTPSMIGNGEALALIRRALR